MPHIFSLVSLGKLGNTALRLGQRCPTRDPGDGFVQPGLGFLCSKSILHTDNLFLL